MNNYKNPLLGNLVPRNLRAESAAHYVDVSPSKFHELVRDGRMPKPFRIDGCVLWDKTDLDVAIDRLKAGSGGEDRIMAKIDGMRIPK
jgi:predicted DNA-binding transcriptional regulator AlpA